MSAMAGFRQGNGSKTVPADIVPSSRGEPKPESIRKQVKLTKAQVRFRLLDTDPDHRTDKLQAISALLRVKEERKDLLQEVLATVCLALRLECSSWANTDQDMIGNLLSVLVHASDIDCDLTQSYEQLQNLLEFGTVAQKHSVAIIISKIEESEMDISPLIRTLVKALGSDSCDPTARMVIAKTLVNAATRTQQYARTIYDEVCSLRPDPGDPYIARVIARSRSVARVSDRPVPPLKRSQPPPHSSKPGAFVFDTIVNEDPRAIDPTEKAIEEKPGDEIPLEDVVRLLWESTDPMMRKNAVDTLIPYLKGVDEAREVLSMLPAENRKDPNSFVNGIRRRCCRILSEGMPSPDFEEESRKPKEKPR